MIKHIVLWKLNKSAVDPSSVCEELTGMLTDLSQTIPNIKEFTVALSAEAEDDFDIGLDSVFESIDSLNEYEVHPKHLKIKEYMKARSLGKGVFNYEF